MTKTTITKFFGFVIFSGLVVILFSGCRPLGSIRPTAIKSPHYEKPKLVGNIASSDVVESSGLAASQCLPGVFWTHNDSGDDAFIYGLTKSGSSLGTWKVPGARNIDWEDIAEYKDKTGSCFIYIGEIGDNRSKMNEHVIYRVREPAISARNSASTKRDPLLTEPAELLRFRYPDGPHNAETLMVNPKNGEIFVVTKRQTGPAGVYRLKPEFGNANVAQAEKIATISVPSIPNGLITGGDISPDGRRMILCDYVSGYEYVLPENSDQFDDIWKQAPEIVDLGNRPVGEAVCYAPDGNSLYATSEGRSAAIFEIVSQP